MRRCKAGWRPVYGDRKRLAKLLLPARPQARRGEEAQRLQGRQEQADPGAPRHQVTPLGPRGCRANRGVDRGVAAAASQILNVYLRAVSLELKAREQLE